MVFGRTSEIIITTIDHVPNATIEEHFGMVSGSVVRSKHFGTDMFAGLKNLVGGELEGYTKLLNETRQQALERLADNARMLGANAVVNVRLESSSVAAGAAELYAYGTAVKVVFQ